MLDFSVTFIFTLINIFVLFIILRLILFKPVARFMRKRAEAIEADLGRAESEKQLARNVLQTYETRLSGAEAEAGEIIRLAREEARRQADKIVEEGRAEAKNILQMARTQTETQSRVAMETFQAEAAALVITAASRLLARELTSEDTRKQAELILRSIGKK